MNDRAVREISQRLSLRTPQREALGTLGEMASALALPTSGADRSAFERIKGGNRAAQLAACAALAPSLANFDRAFPSFCFALATGVGKTRLMGAQIAYLHRVHGVQNFFVVAPNLTIYDKLRRDFTPNTPKYVFAGLPDFVTRPPELITGDDWESGRGARGKATVRGVGADLWNESVQINLFNVSKFDTKDGARMRQMHEAIGTSYFDYLSSLPDLVLLMDESHRYRAAAAATALNDLKPLLGIELTATPQVQRGVRVEPFTNVAYRYGLAEAIRDGFVKKPAVAGRLNLDTANTDPAQLERIKLEDALVLHEQVKAELAAYAERERVPRVKPFVLVIARDTTHAEGLQVLMSAPDFHGGIYSGRVITVHSNRTGSEKDEVVQRLLRVEDPAEPTEIVIHVEMLKEGWDVTNLYTVVPLRAANSRTLVEQSIGRGLRLPYGRQTGVAAVDRLTIVAHDKFQEIVDEAERGDSPFKLERVMLGDGENDKPLAALIVQSSVEAMFAPTVATTVSVVAERVAAPAPLFAKLEEATAARITYNALADYRGLATSAQLQSPEHQAALVAQVREKLTGGQLALDDALGTVNVEEIVRHITSAICGTVIDIPRILLQPLGDTQITYDDVPLAPGGFWYVLPEQDIVVRELQSRVQEYISAGLPATEARLEDYIVRVLIDSPDLDYQEHGNLLYARATEAVAAIREYEADEERLHGIVGYHARDIARKVGDHLRRHRHEVPAAYEPVVKQGWSPLAGRARTVAQDEAIASYREPPAQLSRIRQMRFGRFQRCLFPEVQFESDGERRFSMLLEDSLDRTTRWFRPDKQDIRIFWSADRQYVPDFIVETSTHRLVVEIKDPGEIDSREVQAKGKAAAEWCTHASAHSALHGGKPWRYLLVPDEEVRFTATIDGLMARFS